MAIVVPALSHHMTEVYVPPTRGRHQNQVGYKAIANSVHPRCAHSWPSKRNHCKHWC